MITLTDRGAYWELELINGRAPQYVRGSQASLTEVRDAVNAQLEADTQRDPTETERRSWLRVVQSEQEANLPSR